jgi:hypothetical protein
VERYFAGHVSREQARVLAEVFRDINADLDGR